MTQSVDTRIQNALEELRPYLAQHLGDIAFVKFEQGTVFVKMLGTCDGCPLSQLTLKAGVEELLRERVGEVERVEAV